MRRYRAVAAAALLPTNNTPCSVVVRGSFDMSYFAADLLSVDLLTILDAGVVTVFVPSDSSFGTIPTGHKGMLTQGSEMLKSVMLHHIHQGAALH
eukprot:gene42860-57741_t